MKKISLLFVLISAMGFAQTHRFIYEYKFAPKKARPDSLVTEMMALDIDSKGSIYQSLAKIRRDSSVVSQINMAKNIAGPISIDMRGMFVKVNYAVQKEYPNYKTYLINQVKNSQFKVLEEEKQIWKISPETQKISGYHAQKATTSWGGRDWTAWFATELPFQDGPYKFCGLPGLIVKIEDATGTQQITLMGNKNIEKTANAELYINNKMIIAVNESQFKKLWKDYVNDPGSGAREMAIQTETRVLDADGKPMDINALARNAEKNSRKRLKENNNYIEPDLFDVK